MSLPLAAILWLGVGVIAAVIEGFTIQLISIWFTVGAIAAAGVALLNGDFSMQLIMFSLVSLLLLVCIRPFAKKRLAVQKQPTNADQLIGMIATVTVPTDVSQGVARVTVRGMEWAARTQNDAKLQTSDQVEVLAIEGATLIVALVASK